MDGGSPPLYSDTWVNIIVIEESRFPPIVTPLDVSVSSYLDEFPGGVMGRVHAVDQDPYDKLLFDIISPHQNLFSMDREDGTIVALPGLDVGNYELNVSVSDGKFTVYTSVSVEVIMISEDAVRNSVAIRLDDVTPEDFLLTYKKGFLRGLRRVLNVRVNDVEIVSLQPMLQEKNRQVRSTEQDLDMLQEKNNQIQSMQQVLDMLQEKNNEVQSAQLNLDTLQGRNRQSRSTQQDLDVVFAVRAGSNGYHPADMIRSKVKEKTEVLEASVGLKVVKVS